jgi:hypothetical protein
MVDPVYTYVGGIAFLVLIIGSMLYLTFSTYDVEEDSPGESVVGGLGTEEAEHGGAEDSEPDDAEEQATSADEERTEAEQESDEGS